MSSSSLTMPDLASSAPLQAQADALMKQAANPGKENAKIDKSAHDFESILLGNWLQNAESSFAEMPGGDDSENADAGSGSLQGIAMQALGNAMASNGGIGIGKMIANQLHKADPVAPKVPPG